MHHGIELSESSSTHAAAYALPLLTLPPLATASSLVVAIEATQQEDASHTQLLWRRVFYLPEPGVLEVDIDMAQAERRPLPPLGRGRPAPESNYDNADAVSSLGINETTVCKPQRSEASITQQKDSLFRPVPELLCVFVAAAAAAAGALARGGLPLRGAKAAPPTLDACCSPMILLKQATSQDGGGLSVDRSRGGPGGLRWKRDGAGRLLRGDQACLAAPSPGFFSAPAAEE